MRHAPSGEGLSSHRLNPKGLHITIVGLGWFGRWVGFVFGNVFRGPELSLQAARRGDQFSSV